MLEKNKIEDWVKVNKELFDDKELPVNHRELFESKLDSFLEKEKPTKQNISWMRVAATFIVGIGIASSVFYFTTTEIDSREFASNDSFEKVEQEYSVKIKEALVPVRANKNYLSREYISFIKEMEKLDTQNDKLKEILLTNPNDERIFNSIIENYKNRLKLLEQLKTIMANKNLKNTPNLNNS